MSKLAVMATIEVLPGRRSEFLPFLTAHRARSLKEPGTLQFELMTPRDDETKVMLYEVYRDESAFEAHRTGPSIAQLRKDAAGLIAKITIAQGTPVE